MKHVCASVFLFVVLSANFEFREALPSAKVNSQEDVTDFEVNSIPSQKGALKSVGGPLKSLLKPSFALDGGLKKRVKISQVDSKEDSGRVGAKKLSEKSSKNGNYKTEKVTLSNYKKSSSTPAFDRVESTRDLRDASREDSEISPTILGNSRAVENFDGIAVPQASHAILSKDESLHPESKDRSSVSSEDQNILDRIGRSQPQKDPTPSNIQTQSVKHIRIARFGPSTETPENFNWMDGVSRIEKAVDQPPASNTEDMPISPYTEDFPLENVSPEIYGPEKSSNECRSNFLFQNSENSLPTTECPDYRAIEDDILYLDHEHTRENDKCVLSDIVSRLKGALQTVEQQVKKSESHQSRLQPLPVQTEMTKAESEAEEKVTQKFLGFLQQFLGLYQLEDELAQDHGLGMRRAIQDILPALPDSYSKPQAVVPNTLGYPGKPREILKEEKGMTPLTLSRQSPGGITIFSYPNKSRDIFKEGGHFAPIVFSKPLTTLFAHPEKGSKEPQIEKEHLGSPVPSGQRAVIAPIFAYPEKSREIKNEKVPTSSSVHLNPPALISAPVVAYPENSRGIPAYEKPLGFVVPATTSDVVSQTKLYKTEDSPQNHQTQSATPRVIAAADLCKYFQVVGETHPINRIPEKDQGSIERFTPPKITIPHHTGVQSWNVFLNPAAQKLQNHFVISKNNYKTLDSRPDSGFNQGIVYVQKPSTQQSNSESSIPVYKIQNFDYAISNEENSDQPPRETNPWVRSTTETPINSDLGFDIEHDLGISRHHQRTKENRPRSKDSRAHQHRLRGENGVSKATEDQQTYVKDSSQPQIPVITTIESTQSQQTESVLEQSLPSEWNSIAVNQHPSTQQIQPSVSSVNSAYSAYVPNSNQYLVNPVNIASHPSIQPQYSYHAPQPMPVQEEAQFRVVPAETSVSGYENLTANFPSLVPAPVVVQRVNASQFVVKHQEPLIINFQSDPYIMDWYQNSSQVHY